MNRKNKTFKLLIIFNLLYVIGIGSLSADSICIESTITVVCRMTEYNECTCNIFQANGLKKDCCTIQQEINIEQNIDSHYEIEKQLIIFTTGIVLPLKSISPSIISLNSYIPYFPPPLENVKLLC